jgi:hypothetical protein
MWLGWRRWRLTGAAACGCASTTARRSPRAAAASSTVPRSSSSPTTSTCRAPTPSRASASSTPSRTTSRSTVSDPRTSSAGSSTRRHPGPSPRTALQCTKFLKHFIVDCSFLRMRCEHICHIMDLCFSL